MNNNSDLFTHTIIDNKADKTLFLLHGTGGTENDFLFLDELLDKKYNLVGLRGNIVESGMSRFFKRHSVGVFDEKSIKNESEKLRKFIKSWMSLHKIKIDDLVFLGYSNGANILLATLFYYPEVIKNLVLLHPMLPFEPNTDSLNLTSHTAFLSYGKDDHLISEEDSKKIINLLSSLNANLTVKEFASGHEVTQTEIDAVVTYLSV